MPVVRRSMPMTARASPRPRRRATTRRDQEARPIRAPTSGSQDGRRLHLRLQARGFSGPLTNELPETGILDEANEMREGGIGGIAATDVDDGGAVEVIEEYLERAIAR